MTNDSYTPGLKLQLRVCVDNEPLPPEMYTQTVGIRILRHAAWWLMISNGVTNAVLLISEAQKDVAKMSTGDFYSIKNS